MMPRPAFGCRIEVAVLPWQIFESQQRGSATLPVSSNTSIYVKSSNITLAFQWENHGTKEK
jgi:hypothetical protein